MDLLTILQTYPIVEIIKDRQVGVSWIVSGYTDWKCGINNLNSLALLLSQGEKDAWKLLAKVRFIHDRLPDWLRLKIGHSDSRELIDFAGTESRIESLPSTQKAGRGTDASVVVRDECAFHPYAEENYSAITPSIDAGGQRIDISTIDPWDEKNHFTKLILRSLEGTEKTVLPSGLEIHTRPESDTVVVYIPWTLRPVRREGMTQQEFWDKVIVPNYDEAQRQAEYSGTLENALKPPSVTCRFDTDAINSLKAMAVSPLDYERNGLVRIYNEPQPGFNYIFVIDPSQAGEDPSTGIIADSRSLLKVADFRGMIPHAEQALIIKDLYDRYYKPFTVVERNAGGISLIRILEELEVENLYRDGKGKVGWYTHSVNRVSMINDLAEAVRLRAIGERSEDALNQFLSFIRTPRKPQGEARGGAHDDFVMAWAILLQAVKEMPIGEVKFMTITPRVRY